jgi:bifunctional oligoribonuclease and PAP phosphatase NrnA
MYRKIKAVVDAGRRFLLTSHIDPDGDAVGSVFALYWALKSAGKDATVYLKDKIPYSYEFLPGPPDLRHDLPEEEYDAVFVIDCGNLHRAGEGYEKLLRMGRIINIDHHTTSETFGSINLIEPDASSTGEILYRLFAESAIPVNYEMAVNLYTSISTDTGSFRYQNTNSSAFLICEEMMRKGVKPAYVAQMVHENHPKERFLLLGLVLNTLETHNKDRVALVHVTEEMFDRTHTTREHTDGFVEYVREIRGVEAAILLREAGRLKYKASMRSKGRVDVAAIGALFGGGGHRNAAGCLMEGTLDDVRKRLLEAIKVE